MLEDKINDYINNNPKRFMQMCTVVVFIIWQSAGALLGLVLYLIVSKYPSIKWWHALIMAAGATLVALFFEQYYAYAHIDLIRYIQHGFMLNRTFWSCIVNDNLLYGLEHLIQESINYLISVPFLLIGILKTTDLINSNHLSTNLRSLQKGNTQADQLELPQAIINKKIKNIDESKFDGTIIGVSKYTGLPVLIPDHHINCVMLIFGTTGGGKTITIRNFYRRAILKGYPQIYVDGKPDDKNIKWLMALAEKHGVPFYGFNCGKEHHYNPLAYGGYTELKDKIMSLKDEWSNEYYKSVAEDYLQTAFEVLSRTRQNYDLKKLVDLLDYENLLLLARESGDTNLFNRVEGLANYDLKDISGLRAHLNILAHSELGQYFEEIENSFNLKQIIDENAIVYFALPALSFPSFSKVLGKLVINDIKCVINKLCNHDKKIFTIFDEFSVFAGDQVLNLVNMGRGKGVHAIFGTQGLADLEKNDLVFKRQILNCANTIICHRLNDKDSAEDIANWIGTKDALALTAQLNIKDATEGLGSIRQHKEFIIHPDQIKQTLDSGDAFYVTKMNGFRFDKIQVNYI